ncbi:MAG TPA: YerC/YecD family TrpR-related protein [Candidatus Paceibacterota bacterium]
MDWKRRENKGLIDAVLALKSRNEAERFLRDLLTEEEIEEFTRRFQTAQLLSDSVPYSQIRKKTGLSTTTIARVSKWLKGNEGGYRLIIARLHHHASVSRGRGLR